MAGAGARLFKTLAAAAISVGLIPGVWAAEEPSDTPPWGNPAASAGTTIAELEQGDLHVTVSQVPFPRPATFELSPSDSYEPGKDDFILLNYTYENVGDESIWFTGSERVAVYSVEDAASDSRPEDRALGWYSITYGDLPAYAEVLAEEQMNVFLFTEEARVKIADSEYREPLFELKPGERTSEAGLAVWNGEPSLVFSLVAEHPDYHSKRVGLLPAADKPTNTAEGEGSDHE